MNHLEFFALKEDPFKITPDISFYYPSSTHNEIKLLFKYMLEQREGFFVCTGEPGTGKTFVIRHILQDSKLTENANIALILTPRLTPEEFLQTLIEELGITIQTTNKNVLLRTFKQHLIEQNQSGKTVVIIVDEAQNLPDETLEELRLLSNLETDKEKLLQIVIVGQPELDDKLQSEAFRQLNQRITLKISLRPLTYEETSDYISHRLTIAGRGNVQFSDKARRLIYNHSKGIPRLINVLCSRSMMTAFLQSSHEIKPEHVKIAINHLQKTDTPAKSKFPSKPFIVLTSIVLCLAIASLAFFEYSSRQAPVQSNQPISVADLPPSQAPTQTSEPPKSLPTDMPSQIKAQPQASKSLKAPKIAVIVSNAVNVRAEPDINSDKIDRLTKGQEVPLLEIKEGADGRRWGRVIIAEDKEGWVSETSLKIIKAK